MNNNLIKLFNETNELNGIPDERDAIIERQQSLINSLNMKIGELELANDLLINHVDELKTSLTKIRIHLKKDCSRMWTGPIHQANFVIDEALKKDSSHSIDGEE